jgi:hypothetical protein
MDTAAVTRWTTVRANLEDQRGGADEHPAVDHQQPHPLPETGTVAVTIVSPDRYAQDRREN